MTSVTRLQNENRVLEQQAGHYRRAYEELDARKSQDIEILMQEKQSLMQKDVDMSNRSIMQEKELEESRDLIRQLKRDLEATKSDCNNMMKILEDYETKVSLYQQKEEGFNKLSKECKQKMEESVVEKDRLAI
jgi:hypothetical protein